MDVNTEQSFGDWLKEQRSAKKITLEEIAAVTKVHIAQLKYLEANDLKKLPPMAFVRGFLVSYAQHVGLNENEVLSRFKVAMENAGQELASLPRTSKIAKTKSDADVKIVNAPDFKKSVVVQRNEEDEKPMIQPKTAAWIGAVFILVSIIVTLIVIGRDEIKQKEPAPAPESQVAATTPTPTTTETPSTTPAATPEPTPTVTATPTPAAPPPTPAPAPVATTTPAPTVPPTEVPAAKNLTLEVSAFETTWVHVRADADRARGYNLTNGSRQVFNAERRIVLSLSNAGAVQIKWNGENLGVPGYRGDVKSIILPDELMELRKVVASRKEAAPAVKKPVAPSATPPAGTTPTAPPAAEAAPNAE